jgi:hypothetical protein
MFVGRKNGTYEYDEEDDKKPHAGLETCAERAGEQAELLMPLKELEHAEGDDLN